MAVGVIIGRFDPTRGLDAQVTMTFGGPAPSYRLPPSSSSKRVQGSSSGWERG